MLGQGLDLGALVVATSASLFLHAGQRRLEVLGLQAAAGVTDQFPDKQTFGLVVLDVVVPAVAAAAIGQPEFLPALGGINGAVELVGIDEGLDHQHRMLIAGLPIRAEPIQGQAQHARTHVGTVGPWQDKETAVIDHQA